VGFFISKGEEACFQVLKEMEKQPTQLARFVFSTARLKEKQT
jgi:hypothetical protein